MQPKVTLYHCAKWSDAQYNREVQETRLNLPKCKEYAKEYGIDFLEYVARCLNHEFLHHLLYEEQDKNTSRALDNIAKKFKDEWLW